MIPANVFMVDLQLELGSFARRVLVTPLFFRELLSGTKEENFQKSGV